MPDRVLFPADGITKGDLVEYSAEIAGVMLPHLKARPLTLWRYPRGIDQQGFVQQDFPIRCRTGWGGRGRQGRRHRRAPGRRPPRGPGWLANQNCVTVHAWLSRRDRLHAPDQHHLRPGPVRRRLRAVRAAARRSRTSCEDLGLGVLPARRPDREACTSSRRSRADTDFDTVRQFARDVADVVAADDPAHRTVEMRKNKRGDRMYIDIMRNAYAQTAVAPYAVRARRGAPVATPLEWDELDRRGTAGRPVHAFETYRSGWPTTATRGPISARRSTLIARPDATAGQDSMPELPDVEGFRRQLADALPGRQIRSVDVLDSGVSQYECAVSVAEADRSSLRQATQARQVADPATDGPTLLVHSGMTGHPYARRTKEGQERLVIRLDRGELRYADLRKLRGVWLAADDDETAGRDGRSRVPMRSALDLPSFRQALQGRPRRVETGVDGPVGRSGPGQPAHRRDPLASAVAAVKGCDQPRRRRRTWSAQRDEAGAADRCPARLRAVLG